MPDDELRKEQFLELAGAAGLDTSELNMEEIYLYVLKLVEEGRISTGRAAELLDTSIYDIYHMAETRGIRLGATKEQQEMSREYAQRL